VLAVVQSILRLTKAQNVDAYVAAVEGRIKALSHAHMLLSESRWEGADLGRLFTEELEPYRIGDVVSISGPDTTLDPRRAQTLALAVHELATNAAKYGALKTSFGKVKLTWRDEENGLYIEWLESGGPRVSAPDTQGYGTRVIRATLEQLGGGAVFEWRPTGLCCTLSLPRDSKGRNGRPNSKQSGFRRKFEFGLSRNSGNVLLVEDEAMVVMMVEEVLNELGLRMIGPYGTVDEALRAVRESSVDAAVLDINLEGRSVFPVVDLLLEKRVPVAFISGYGAESLDSRYAHIPFVQKPIDRRILIELFTSCGDAGGDTISEKPDAPAARDNAKVARL
jgi:two-component sensor histidine kinase/CheY-like chemotaxis protein